MEVKKKKLPVYSKTNKGDKTYFCLGYQNDLDQAYAFYCARYKDISYEEFLNIGISTLMKKLSSIPKSEPLYDIIKSRTINLTQIKDKEERKYWRELKKINRIPEIFIPTDEIYSQLKGRLKETNKVGGN